MKNTDLNVKILLQKCKTEIMEKLEIANEYKIVVLLFGVAYASENKEQQFYTDLDSFQQYRVLQKLVKFKDFSRPLSDFPVLFKAELIFKDYSSKPSKFKFFPSLCEPSLIAY